MSDVQVQPTPPQETAVFADRFFQTLVAKSRAILDNQTLQASNAGAVRNLLTGQEQCFQAFNMAFDAISKEIAAEQAKVKTDGANTEGSPADTGVAGDGVEHGPDGLAGGEGSNPAQPDVERTGGDANPTGDAGN